jgi:hypothetical protein
MPKNNENENGAIDIASGPGTEGYKVFRKIIAMLLYKIDLHIVSV